MSVLLELSFRPGYTWFSPSFRGSVFDSLAFFLVDMLSDVSVLLSANSLALFLVNISSDVSVLLAR